MAGTKEIALSNTGDHAIVDESDYEFVSSFGKWMENDQGYAVKRCKVDGKKTTIRMHSLINGTPPGLVTDHINGNKLDNRRENLRSVGQMINAWNKERNKEHTKYELPSGVTYDKSRNKYVATKTVRKRFDTLEEAIEFTKQSEKEIYVRHS